MTMRDGTPIWYDLMTDAPDPAQAFYGPLMGWTFARLPGGMDRDYRTVTASDGAGVGGVMAAGGAPFAPIWTVYFGVADVDRVAARVTQLGGAIHMEPQDIPGVGRFAFVADPQGAMFYLMRGDGDGPSTAFAPLIPGHCAWNELVTRDQADALAFYGALFGWQKTGAMPMGDAGDYTFIASGDTEIGAMMTSRDPEAAAFWNFAFTVPDIDAAKRAIKDGGGTVTHGPIALPGDEGDWLIQATDPQGAKVMVGGKRKAGAE